MWLLGFLHDVGKRFEGFDNHEEVGFRILDNANYSNAPFVRDHGTVPKGDTISLVDCFLKTADMSVDQYGRDIGFDARLEDIKLRHGEDSEVYKNSKKIIEFLKWYSSGRNHEDKPK